MSGSDTFRITLTPEQKEQVRKATGKEASTIELTAEELEERIAHDYRRQAERVPQVKIHGTFTKAVQIAPSFRHTSHNTHKNILPEDIMKDQKNQFRIELTPDQKNQVRHATGKDAEAVELSVEELEERIAPSKLTPKPK